MFGKRFTSGEDEDEDSLSCAPDALILRATGDLFRNGKRTDTTNATATYELTDNVDVAGRLTFKNVP